MNVICESKSYEIISNILDVKGIYKKLKSKYIYKFNYILSINYHNLVNSLFNFLCTHLHANESLLV